MKKTRSFLAILTIIAILGSTAIAARPDFMPKKSQSPSRHKGTRKTQQTREEKRQQLESGANSAISEINSLYKTMADYVNTGQKPTKEELRDAKRTVLSNRKYMIIFDDSQKVQYHNLSALVYYFDGKIEKAAKSAASSQKIMAGNPNAAKTRISLAITYQDYDSMIDSLICYTNDIPSTAENTPKTFDSHSQHNDEQLQLDINSLRTELIASQCDTNFIPLDSNMPQWQTKGRVVCALLWGLEEQELEKFAPAPEKQKDPNEESAEQIEKNHRKSRKARHRAKIEQKKPEPIEIPEFKLFSELHESFFADPRIAFAAVNINSAEKKQNLINWLKAASQSPQTVQLPPEKQQILSSLIEYPAKPVLLVVSPNSIVRYAGNVDGFLPKMVINRILEEPESLKAIDANLPAIEYKTNPIPAPDSQKQLSPEQQMQINFPSMGIPAVKTAKPPKTAAPAIVQNTGEDFTDPQAEKLLEYARGFFKIGNKTLVHTYQKPINMCRRVMRDYPNTKYSQEAQMLLRQVPERFRQRYKLTDAELGL